MKNAIKYALIGVSLIVAGLVLNYLVMWIYEQSIQSYPGDYPPPRAIMAGTMFLALIPLGIIFLAYSLYLMFREYRVEIRISKDISGFPSSQ